MQFLVEQVQGASKFATLRGGEEEEDEVQTNADELRDEARFLGEKYEIVGTLRANFLEKPNAALRILKEDDETFPVEIMKCGFVVYDISFDRAEIPKALAAMDG